MITDSAFYIGTTHKICQDYAISTIGTAILSDGCSSSKNSDIGARILSRVAYDQGTIFDDLHNFNEKECIYQARPIVKMLNLSNECLDATLLIVKSNSVGIQALCCGDGIIAIGTKDKHTIIIDCTYTDSYPFYMNYLCRQSLNTLYDGLEDRYVDWTENHNKRLINQTVLDPKKEIISAKIVEENQRLYDSIGLIRVLDYSTLIEIADGNLVEYVAIMSDGVHSFYETVTTETSKVNNPISYLDVLRDLLSFKSFYGDFVQRRVNKFRKSCKKKNWVNVDDVSLATLHWIDTDES